MLASCLQEILGIPCPAPPPHRYQDAAVTFSQSQLSFEEVALKFIQVNRKDALMTFLTRKLDGLGEGVSHGIPTDFGN